MNRSGDLKLVHLCDIPEGRGIPSSSRSPQGVIRTSQAYGKAMGVLSGRIVGRLERKRASSPADAPRDGGRVVQIGKWQGAAGIDQPVQ